MQLMDSRRGSIFVIHILASGGLLFMMGVRYPSSEASGSVVIQLVGRSGKLKIDDWTILDLP